MKLNEFRKPEIEYVDETTKVIAQLRSYKSASYTNLAKKLERIDELGNELKSLKEEVKNSTKEDIAELFDANDVVNTRVVRTVSYIFTLSKNPKETVTPKYKEILSEIEKHLAPELLTMLEMLKNEMVTKVQKSPSLSYEKIKESFISNAFSKIKMFVLKWAKKYDEKLDNIERMMHL